MFVVNDRNLSIAILSYSHHTYTHWPKFVKLHLSSQVAIFASRQIAIFFIRHAVIMHAPFGEFEYFVLPSAIAPPKLHRSPLWPSFMSRQICNLLHLPSFASRQIRKSIYLHLPQPPFIPNYLDSLPHSTRSKGSKCVTFLSVPDNPPPHHRRIVRHIAT